MGAFLSRLRRRVRGTQKSEFTDVNVAVIKRTESLSTQSTSQASSTTSPEPSLSALVAPEAIITPIEQQVLAILRRRFANRAGVTEYMCLQLMRSSDLKPHGLGDPNRVEEWAQWAGNMVESNVTWREANAIDGLAKRLLDRSARFKEMWPEGVQGVDKYGRPIHWQRIAQIPAEAMMREFTTEEIITLHVQGTERCREACLDKCRRDGLVFIGQVEVLDLTGFGMQHLSRRFWHLIRAVMDVDL